MKILALDSSSLTASVAIITEEGMTAEYTINYKKTHSQTLLPMLDEIVKQVKLDLTSIDAIAVSSGPGSFTGLRIGSATAKGLGLALNKPIISISTLEAMAYNFFGSSSLIVPIMDARRNQVYTAIYEFDKESLITIMEPCALDIRELIEELNKKQKSIILTGDGIPSYAIVLEEELKNKFYFAPAHLNRQRAGAVGALARIYLQKGQIESAREHKPVYLRISQAERELAEREAKK